MSEVRNSDGTTTYVQDGKDKKRGKGCLIAGAIIIAFLALVSVMPHPRTHQTNHTNPSSYGTTQYQSSTHSVMIEVTGTASGVSVYHTNDTGGNQTGDYALPYRRVYGRFPTGEHFYASAQNMDRSGTVTVTITVDGEILDTSTSSGSFCIATASGYVR